MTKKCKVLYRTDQLTREEWLNARREGIGGSDAGVILGLSRFASPYSLWVEKSGLATDTFEGNEATQWGNDLEPVIAARYAKTYNKAVVAVPVMLQSIANPFMLANVDFFIVTPSELYPEGVVTHVEDFEQVEESIIAILEVKTNGLVGRASREWDNNGIPKTYEAQGLHYCAVLHWVDVVVFAALIGGSGLQVRERLYKYDEVQHLIDAERAFWRSVQDGNAPEPLGLDADFDILKSQYPVSEPVAVEADDFLYDTVQEYRRAKMHQEAAEQIVKELRAKIEASIGFASELTFEGRTLLTYKSNKPGVKVDTKRLVEENPELADRYKVETPGARVLRLKEEN